MASPWRDALKKAEATPVTEADVLPIDLMPLSPKLASLLAEREQLDAQMAALTGQDNSDPRFYVEPMAVRRAAYKKWEAARDTQREGAGRPKLIDESALRGDNGQRPPPRSEQSVAGKMLRAIGSDIPKADAARERVRGLSPEMPGLQGLEPAHAAVSDISRGDASGLTNRAFERWPGARDLMAKYEKPLRATKDFISDDWRQRAKDAIPTLEKNSGYARRVEKLLGVEVGTLDQIREAGELIKTTRELRDADAAGDDKRRERAIEKLMAKRQERY